MIVLAEPTPFFLRLYLPESPGFPRFRLYSEVNLALLLFRVAASVPPRTQLGLRMIFGSGLNAWTLASAGNLGSKYLIPKWP